MSRFLLMLAVLAIWAAPLAALAHWDEYDPHKMHYPQLPNPDGWDVRVSKPKLLADDFRCEETGWITDVHFWGSWKDDLVGKITRIHLSIHENVPVGPGGYSIPGDELWAVDFDPRTVAGVVIRWYETGVQGWFDPNVGEGLEANHLNTYQVNVFLDEIFPLSGLFIQEKGTIYWLDIQVEVDDPIFDVDFGWKTSLDHWEDVAVWADWSPGEPKPGGGQWEELFDPITGESLTLAFVITGIPIPEPAMFALAGLGLLALLGVRRKK